MQKSAIIPPLMPEEFIKGWRGRVAVLNEKRGFKESTRLLQWHASSRDLLRYDRRNHLKILSGAIDITLEQLVRAHTLLPYYAATAMGRDVPYSLMIQRHWNCFSGHRAIYISNNIYPMFCRECVKEDLDFWGFSYWRRHHQLPGKIECSKHDSLLKSARMSSAFLQSPDASMNDCMDLPVNVSACRRNPYVAKANLLAEAILLEARRTRHPEDQTLRRRLGEIHLGKASKTKRAKNDRFLALFPPDWVKLVFQDFNMLWESDDRNLCGELGPGGNLPVPSHNAGLILPSPVDTTRLCMMLARSGDEPEAALDEIAPPDTAYASPRSTQPFEQRPRDAVAT